MSVPAEHGQYIKLRDLPAIIAAELERLAQASPDAVESLAVWHYNLTHEGGEKHGTPWIKASEEEKEKSRKQARDNLGECLPAIIAQEREKWEAEQEVELALLGVEKCSGEGIGFHNARAEKAKDERDKAKASHYCTCGKEHRPSGMAGTGVIDAPGHPIGPGCRFLTWEEVAKENQTKALEWRKVAKERERVIQSKAQALAELGEADQDGERCEDCGGPVGLVWWCHDDALWEKVTGRPTPRGSREPAGGILCINCFDAKARKVCPWIEWAPLNLRHLQSREESEKSAAARAALSTLDQETESDV